MSALLPLDSRQARITRLLLADDRPSSTQAIAAELELTPRVVRYNLPLIESYLRSAGLQVVRRRGLGVWISGEEEQRRAILASLDPSAGPQVLDTADRKLRALAALLDRAPEPIQLADLEVELGASRPTVRRDVRAAEAWLEEHHLHLQRIPGVGIVVRGSELDVRKGLLALVLEAVPAEALLSEDERSAGLEGVTNRPLSVRLGRLGTDLDLPTHRSILAEQLHELDENGPMAMVAALYLAIVTRRVRAGHGAELQSGQLRSLIEHPVTDAATRIAAAVEASAGLTMGEADVAAITEFLLGFVELADVGFRTEADDDSAVDRIVTSAATRLHPALAEDDQLRRTLGEHLRRLRIRLRYGLPVSNPLDHEVRERYPDVYAVARDIAAELGPLGDAIVPPEEVGFLTMYLAGSLERNRLRPKVRITVVCPAGMATAWILVSRLLAEFPQVEVGRVVSKTEYERDPEDPGTGLVVSTVPLDEEPDRPPTIVVSPLLHERDVRHLSRILGEPTH
ncbi:MAG: transcription antiterminator [Chloroflexi bacterium]|nr:MAG: transcription antiterminator [Chloroflexota bacterium]